MYESDYLRPEFLAHIPRSDVQIIFELGARDGADAVALRDYFGAEVTCFECNPHGIAISTVNLAREPYIKLVSRAAWDSNTEIDFYPVVEAKWQDGRPVVDQFGALSSNIGASSCYRARGDYLQRYVQEQIRVKAIRLEDYCMEQSVERIDLLCVDVQGAALRALRGLGTMLGNVKYVLIELEFREIYEGQDLYRETSEFLRSSGFDEVVAIPRDDWFSDFFYIRRGMD